MHTRRTFLRYALATGLASPVAALAEPASRTNPLSKEQRDRLSPEQVIETLKEGNARFRTGHMFARDYRSARHATAAGQFPAAALVGCVDSRAPAEIIFDTGIGDIFSARLAGNVVDDDVLGSLEFTCDVAGAKAVVLFGHTACAAVKGAIDGVELGNLTALLARIKPAVAATEFHGERASKNAAYVDAVARTNVRLALEDIRQRSPILAGLENKGAIRIVGAMYDLTTGAVQFGV
jgi:carbonic anhydrase